MYNTSDSAFQEMKLHARDLTREYNLTRGTEKEKRREVLGELFGSIGQNIKVDTPFYCDYGKHIFIGNNVIININCTFVDCNKISIGNNVMIASNVQIYTATHPVETEERLIENWDEASDHPYFRTYALPVIIGNNVWLGGGVIVLPGVTIGDNSVIGAGSVVNKSIPANSVAVGNPCRVVKQINK